MAASAGVGNPTPRWYILASGMAGVGALAAIPLVGARFLTIPLVMAIASSLWPKRWLVTGVVGSAMIFSFTYAATAPNPCQIVFVDYPRGVTPEEPWWDEDCRSRLLLPDLPRDPIDEDYYMALSIAGTVTVLLVGAGTASMVALRRLNPR